MADTRLQAGAEQQVAHPHFSMKQGQRNPQVVTVNFDKLTGPTYDTSLSATADQGRLGYPVYLDSDNNIRAMSETDYRDTFIYATLTDMVSSSESSLTNGTFTITTSASVSNYTEVSGSNTVIFLILAQIPQRTVQQVSQKHSTNQPLSQIIIYKDVVMQGLFHHRHFCLQIQMEILTSLT